MIWDRPRVFTFFLWFLLMLPVLWLLPEIRIDGQGIGQPFLFVVATIISVSLGVLATAAVRAARFVLGRLRNP